MAQEAGASARLPTVLLIPSTTRLDAPRFPGTVAIDPDPINGPRSASVAPAFPMTAVDRRCVGALPGRLGDHTMKTVRAAFDAIAVRGDAIAGG